MGVLAGLLFVEANHISAAFDYHLLDFQRRGILLFDASRMDLAEPAAARKDLLTNFFLVSHAGAEDVVPTPFGRFQFPDGLLADLGHILERSACGAIIQLADVPVSRLFMQVFEKGDASLQAQMQNLPLSAGDDYELCFTVSPQMLKIHGGVFERLGCYCIGEITAQSGLRCLDLQGKDVDVSCNGYQHFK